LLFSCERWGITALHVLVSTVGKKVKVRGLPHLAKNERDVGHPTILGRDKEKMGVAEELTGNERERAETFPREIGWTADPSTTLRFGRDDKGEGGNSIKI
jgi:hypothetical protein